MNYVTAIGMGTATVWMEDGTKRQAACIGGMISMMDNLCRVIPTTWEWGEDIDVVRAQEAKKRAEEEAKAAEEAARIAAEEAAKPKEPTEAELLKEIRDLLKAQQN
jgi:F-type H+-transporting ATPase subunit epsilon